MMAPVGEEAGEVLEPSAPAAAPEALGAGSGDDPPQASLHKVGSEGALALSGKVETLDARVQGAVEDLNAAIDTVNEVERLRAQARTGPHHRRRSVCPGRPVCTGARAESLSCHHGSSLPVQRASQATSAAVRTESVVSSPICASTRLRVGCPD